MMNSDKPTNEFRKWFILPTENEKKNKYVFISERTKQVVSLSANVPSTSKKYDLMFLKFRSFILFC